MGVFHVFKIVEAGPNRTKYRICFSIIALSWYTKNLYSEFRKRTSLSSFGCLNTNFEHMIKEKTNSPDKPENCPN